MLVLPDINQAVRYADHVIAMRDGMIHAHGIPEEVVTPTVIAEIFDISCVVIPDPVSGTPLCVPDHELTADDRGRGLRLEPPRLGDPA